MSTTKPKNHRYIYWDRNHPNFEEMGVLNVGRVSIPVYLLVVGYSVLTFLLLIVGVGFGSALVTPVPFMIAIGMFGFALLVGAIIGLVSLGKFIQSEIRTASEYRR